MPEPCLPPPRKPPRHARADLVLPPPLLRRLQSYVHGLFVYVPSPATAIRRARDMELRRQRAAGMTHRELATLFKISARRVQQILARDRLLAGVAGTETSKAPVKDD